MCVVVPLALPTSQAHPYVLPQNEESSDQNCQEAPSVVSTVFSESS